MTRPAPFDRADAAPGVVEIRDAVRAGRATPRAAVEACLARIAARDAAVRAFVEVGAEAALAAAEDLPTDSPLAGVPFAVKDVLDVAGLPTRMGSRAGDPRPAARDAGCVGLARLAGAIPLGKTVTAEFAGTQPTPVLNPRATSRTPGGSSSGSAAAVADGMVPLAFGTQTGGSVLRPAAFCGIVGFKPSFGLYPVSGMKPAAHSFDTVGILTRSVADAAAAHAALASDAEAAPAGAPTLGLFASHLQDTVEPGAQAAFEAALSRLSASGARIVPVAPPPGFDRITDHRATINAYERARDLAGEWREVRDRLSAETLAVCERGFAISAADYLAARETVDAFRERCAGLLTGVAALVTPTTPGPAPEGHAWAGDPRLQELWTLLHLPSLSLPMPAGAPAPLGLQLIGPRYRDRALLSTALWAEAALA